MESDRRRDAWTVALSVALMLLVLHARATGLVIVAMVTYLLMKGALDKLRLVVPGALAKPAALVAVLAVVGAAGYAIAVLAQPHLARDGGLSSLLDLLADTLERLRTTLPTWLASKLPASLDDLQHGLAASLRSHATSLQRWGHEVARSAAHVFIGLVLGMLAALEAPLDSASPWLAAVRRRGRNWMRAFTDIVTAQLCIAAVNAALTGAFLFAALPLAGVHVPLSGVLVALTFVSSLVPIVGNLVSNAAVVLAALTVSSTAALAAIVFLLLIHKLEYVLNAQLVGHRTKVPAAALLGTMVVFESVFGLGGLVLAPIACAWAFREARESGIL